MDNQQMNSITIMSHSVEETISLGRRVGELCEGQDVLALIGDLGTGKTHFIKGLSQGLGVEDDGAVTSPTFTLMNEYEGRLRLIHIDAYRLKDEQQLEMLGFDDLIDDGSVVVVEWADRVAGLIGSFEPVTIRLRHVGETERELRLEQLPAEWVGKLKGDKENSRM